MADTLNLPVGYDATGLRNNCQIIALAGLTGCSYADAEEAFWSILETNKPGRSRARWTGTTYLGQLPLAASLLGYKVTLRLPHRRMNLRTLVRTLDPAKTYAVIVTGHAVTVRNGMVMDQNGVRPISDTRFKSHRRIVRNIYTLEG